MARCQSGHAGRRIGGEEPGRHAHSQPVQGKARNRRHRQRIDQAFVADIVVAVVVIRGRGGRGVIRGVGGRFFSSRALYLPGTTGGGTRSLLSLSSVVAFVRRSMVVQNVRVDQVDRTKIVVVVVVALVVVAVVDEVVVARAPQRGGFGGVGRHSRRRGSGLVGRSGAVLHRNGVHRVVFKELWQQESILVMVCREA